jgi:hypothetical protein
MSKELRQHINLDSGVIVKEAYWLDGKLHRRPNEGPAVVTRDVSFDYTVMVTCEEYREHGRLHREDGPAQIVRDRKTRTVTLEEYRVKGRLHRNSVQGPALLIRDAKTSIAVREHYVEIGKFHRDPFDGPAIIERNGKTGAVWKEEYWQHGAKLAEPERSASTRSPRSIKDVPTL